MKTVGFTGFKGGIGKSTSCGNVAGILAKAEKQVLVIDCDFQGSATLSFGFNPDTAEDYSIYELIRKERTLEEVIYETANPHIDLIPATLDLCMMEMDLIKDSTQPIDRRLWVDHPHIFQETIDKIKELNKYDYVLLDIGPSLSYFSQSIFISTDIFLVAMQMGKFGFRGTTKFIEEVQRIRSDFKSVYEGHPDYEIHVFSTFFHERNMVSVDYLKKAKSELPNMGVNLVETKIPKTIQYENVQSYEKLPLTLVNDSGPYVAAYKDLAVETKLIEGDE